MKFRYFPCDRTYTHEVERLARKAFLVWSEMQIGTSVLFARRQFGARRGTKKTLVWSEAW